MAEIENKSFLQELYDTKLVFKLPQEEVDDIKEAVYKMVGNIATEIGKVESAFEISHTYLAGSMAEGTSIMQPNEFDYLVVLKNLSQSGAVDIYKQNGETRSCNITEMPEGAIVPVGYGFANCHAHIKPMNSLIVNQFASFITDGLIGNFKMNTMFNECVISVVETIGQVECKTGTLSNGSSAKASLGSASTFNLVWTSSDLEMDPIDISIDLVPAIEVQGIDAANLDPDLTAYNDRLVEHNKHLIVPGKLEYKCFLYTFTNTEVSIVRSLSQNHKTCYMLLKYLLTIRVQTTVVTSYMAKTFVIRHANTCINDKKMHHCIVEIISAIRKSYGTLYTDPSLQTKNSIRSDVRCIFMNTNFVSTRLYDGRECHAIVDALTEIIKRLDNIDQQTDSPDYSFDTCFQKLDTFVRRLTHGRYVLKLNFDEFTNYPSQSFKVNDYDNDL